MLLARREELVAPVADDSTFNHVDDVFGDVTGVIADALKLSRYAEEMN